MARRHAWRRVDAGRTGPGAGPAHPDTARREVCGRHGVELWHAAYQFVPYATDAAGHGGRHHGPWLDDVRTAVVVCAAVSRGTPEAARTSFTGTATPDQAMVLVTTVNCGATQGVFEVWLPPLPKVNTP